MRFGVKRTAGKGDPEDFRNPSYAMSVTGSGQLGVPGASNSGTTPYGASNPGSGGEMSRLAPQVRNPLLNVVNFSFPQDRKVLNQWLRYYDKFHPYVGNILDLHAESIISSFEPSGVQSTEAEKLYSECFEKCDIFNNATAIVRDMFLIGESFPFAQWNTSKGIFDKMVLIDPDYVNIRTHPFVDVKEAATFEVEPPQVLVDFVNSTDPIDMQLQKKMDPKIVAAIKSGQLIRISAFNMTALMKKSSPYEPRGTSIALRCLKDLMYEDKLREAQYAIADAHVAPRWLFKLGDQANKIPPKKKDIQNFKRMLMAGWYDYNFTLVTSYAVQWETMGSQGKILPLVPEFEFVADRVMVGLFANKIALTAEGPTYANGSVARIMLNTRYQNYRSMIEQYVRTKIQTPIAKAHKFYKQETPSEKKHREAMGGERELDLGSLNWSNKLDLTDTNDFRQYIMRLRERGEVPVKLLAKVFGIDYKEWVEAKEKEQGTVFDPLYQDYRKEHMQATFEKTEGAGVGTGAAAGETGGGEGMGGGPEEGGGGEPGGAVEAAPDVANAPPE